MTINVQLRRGSTTVVPQELIEQVLALLQKDDTVNVTVHPQAKVVVVPKGQKYEEPSNG